MTQGNLAVPHRHIVLAAYEAWGHTRPICSLAARLVKSGPVNVTFFTTMSFYDRVSAELVRNFDVHDVNTRERIRLVALENLGESFLDSRSLNVGFEKAYQQLVEESSVTCAKTLTEFPAIPSPDTAIFDIFASQMLAAVRFYSKQPVKVYGWMVCSAAAYQHLFGAVSPNKNGDLRSFIYEEAERSGNSIAEIVEQIFFNTTGEVLSIPGLPPMYDYETAPQHMTVPQSDVGTLMISGAEFIDGCDGVLIATPHAFETPETLEGLAKRMDGNIHVVGPMLASGGDTHGTERKQAAMAQEIDDFMGRIHETRGPKSLVYISFGTVWWSPEPEKIWALLDVMMKRKIPFVFSHGSPLAQIPDDVRAKVEQSGLGLFSPWSPQQYILSHPVTGWFVTHCGYNSVLESIGAGVPMICWPFHADQPTNAIHLTENLDIAYELLEVRTGQGLKPIYRTGKAPIGTLDAVREEAHYVFDKAFGEDGELKRNNIQGLQTSFAKAWEEQGPAHLALRRFLESSAPS